MTEPYLPIPAPQREPLLETLEQLRAENASRCLNVISSDERKRRVKYGRSIALVIEGLTTAPPLTEADEMTRKVQDAYARGVTFGFEKAIKAIQDGEFNPFDEEE